MATFYIQLEDRLLKISGDLTHDNIVRALGYTPSNFSGNFNDLIDNPLTQDGNGEFKIIDESGNIIAIVDSEGIHSVDFIAGEHRLSDKIDKTYVDEAVKNVKVDLTGYATEEYVNDIDFYDIKNNPITNAEEGKLIFVDESGNIGLELDKDNNLVVADVVAGEHILSEKANKNEIPSLSGYATEKFVTDKIAEAELGGEEIDLSEYAKKTDLEGLATEQWVEDKDYLTEHQDISHLATKDEIPSLEGYAKLDDIPEVPSLDGYATESWVEGQNYAKKNEIPSADFNSLENNPFVEDESGELNMTDESGNVGFKLSERGLFVKDVIAGDDILSNKVDKDSLATVATSGSYNDLSNKPTIPSAVTESTVSGWGFTKNTGTYSKPSTGIPKSDLASAVQTSLGKADTAVQPAAISDFVTIDDLAAVATSGSYNDLTDQPDFIKGVAINGTAIANTGGTVYLPNASAGGYGVTRLNSSISSTSTIESATPSAVKAAYDLANSKQDTLISGTNIKTINGQSIVGSGNLIIEGGSVGNYVEKERLGDTEVAYIQGFDTGNMVYGLPGTDANGDADDYLVARNTLKTINGEYIWGSGDIEIRGGSGGGSAAYPEIHHGTSDIVFTLTPNTFHVWDEVQGLDLNFGDPIEGIVNEYIFQFSSPYGKATTLWIPSGILWPASGDLIIEEGKTYIISIVNKFGVFAEYPLPLSGTDPA